MAGYKPMGTSLRLRRAAEDWRLEKRRCAVFLQGGITAAPIVLSAGEFAVDRLFRLEKAGLARQSRHAQVRFAA